MSVLNGIGVSSNQLTYNGSAVGGTPSWDNVTGKPSTFPPTAHTHVIADVTGLNDALTAAGTVKSVNGNAPNDSGEVTIPDATASKSGLMSANDKERLDSITEVSGTVKKVNGIDPDLDGNVALNMIPNSSNIDSIRTTGVYFNESSGLYGIPDGIDGVSTLEVVKTGTGSERVMQRITSGYSCGVQYMRTTNSDGSWRSWGSPLDGNSSGTINADTHAFYSMRLAGIMREGPSEVANHTVYFENIRMYEGSPSCVQLVFCPETGGIYMRTGNGSAEWHDMRPPVADPYDGAYVQSGRLVLSADSTTAVVSFDKTYTSTPAVTATIDISQVGGTVTEPPVAVIKQLSTAIVIFQIINSPGFTFHVNWIAAGTIN